MARPCERIFLEGVGFDALDEREVIDHVLHEVEIGRGGWIVTPNLHILRQASLDTRCARLVNQADLVVADGQPLVWASRLAGTPLPGRVAGSDLIWSLSSAIADSLGSVFLLGGDPGIATRAAHQLQSQIPGLRILGTHAAPVGFDRDPAQVRELTDQLATTRPDLIFVGLPFPMQAEVIERLRPVVPAAWFIACGMALGFAAGQHSRAPRPMQRAGLEWAHRLVHEPRRLGRRYLLEGVPFAARLLTRALAKRSAHGG